MARTTATTGATPTSRTGARATPSGAAQQQGGTTDGPQQQAGSDQPGGQAQQQGTVRFTDWASI
jgi:hypothetical protein